MAMILGMIIGGCLGYLIYGLLNVASKADDHAEIMRDFKEEK